MANYTLKEIVSVLRSDYEGTYEQMKKIIGMYPAIVLRLGMPVDIADVFDSAGVDIDIVEEQLAKKWMEEKANSRENTACTGCKDCKCKEQETTADPADPQVIEDKPKSKRGRKPKATAEKAEKTEPEDTASEYDNKTAKELFNLCKSRGIICEMKKPASYYKDLLIKADAETNAEDEDDWDEEPEEKPKSKRGRKPKAKVEEPEQEPEEEEDEEDDNWDI